MNVMDYNYKLRSVTGQEDDFTANKQTLFDTQVRATFLWSWMISGPLIDYTNMGRIIGCILDGIQTPYVSMKDSIRKITSHFHTSMVEHQGSNDHLQMCNLIYRNILTSLSKKQRNGKASLQKGVLGVDHKMMLNILIKNLHIAVRFFYITN